ncbi:MAG: phosphoribosylformylglycinamidine synthase I, partial [Endomicrobia bacterium]|nr:phosphoribosylformylglycinamidine synthase I [Endomicrobiia bacterium]
MKLKAIVLRVGGTNCDKETVNALKIVGFDTELIHINELIRKEVNLLKFNLLVIPGGFSFGDYISAGKIFAIELFYKLKDMLEEFVKKENNYVIGICNGFQVLVKLGLLPEIKFVQQATLTYNDSGKFECRWVYLKTNKKNPSPLRNLPEVIQLPVAHAEGKFYAEKDVIDRILANNCILFQYCDKDGNVLNKYPINPNGSLLNIAGITDITGKIIGL